MHSRQDILFGIAFVALAAFASTACYQGQWGGGGPLVWPNRARLGETVGFVLTSNYVPLMEEIAEFYDLSADNVSVAITEAGTENPIATVSAVEAVFDGLSAPTGIMNTTKTGAYLTIVVFDLPTSIDPFTTPINTHVRLAIDGVPLAGNIYGLLEITDAGGSPTDFHQFSEPADLQPRPMVRLRGVPDATGQNGFDPTWEIAGIEFTFEYPTSAVASPEAYPATEASKATTLIGPEEPPGSGLVHVVLVDPKGFVLPELQMNGPNRSGEGPLLDIVVDKLPGEGFVAEDFTIRGLKVTDRDGVLLTPPFLPDADTTHFFTVIARKNLAE